MAKTAEKNPADMMLDAWKAVGVAPMMEQGMNWMEQMSDVNAEIAGFIADRIHQDAKLRADLLTCKSLADVQAVQSTFMAAAMEQYQKETERLAAMGGEMLKPLTGDAAKG